MHVNNYGKTPGNLLEIGIGWCEADSVSNLPKRPAYYWFAHPDWIAPGRGSRPIKHVSIPGDLSNPVIFGRFGYRDIFGAMHSDGFVQRRATPILAPRPYTESDPEWDLPEIGKRQYEKESEQQSQND